MLTLPRDVARCRGRMWTDDDFPVAPECQACERWIAHYCHDVDDGHVARVEPSNERDCPLRLAVALASPHA